MSLLIVGGTGTLGRQIVLQALIKGYKVRCLVRNFKRANFLSDWGAELIFGDLTKPETLPICLKGITAVVDASTSRPTEFDDLKNVDFYGKIALIESAKVAKVKKFIFYSTIKDTKDSKIPLVKIKNKIEDKLINSGITYVIFQLTGFYQGLIEQYAIPILENMPILTSTQETPIFYMDTQDIAKFCLRALQISTVNNQKFLLKGTKGWYSYEIIQLCEQFAGQEAKVNELPLSFIKIMSQILGFFNWTQTLSDRLEFVNMDDKSLNSTEELYAIFKIDRSELTQLEDYFVDYFVRLLKRLQDINFEDIQKQKNLII